MASEVDELEKVFLSVCSYEGWKIGVRYRKYMSNNVMFVKKNMISYSLATGMESIIDLYCLCKKKCDVPIQREGNRGKEITPWKSNGCGVVWCYMFYCSIACFTHHCCDFMYCVAIYVAAMFLLCLLHFMLLCCDVLLCTSPRFSAMWIVYTALCWAIMCRAALLCIMMSCPMWLSAELLCVGLICYVL